MNVNKSLISINALHNEIEDSFRTSVLKGIQVGEHLSNVKKHLPHGQFTAWVKENLSFTDRMARNYMQMFTNKDKLKGVNTISEGIKLLAVPKPEPPAPTSFEEVVQAIDRERDEIKYLYSLFEQHAPITEINDLILDGIPFRVEIRGICTRFLAEAYTRLEAATTFEELITLMKQSEKLQYKLGRNSIADAINWGLHHNACGGDKFIRAINRIYKKEGKPSLESPSERAKRKYISVLKDDVKLTNEVVDKLEKIGEPATPRLVAGELKKIKKWHDLDEYKKKLKQQLTN